MPHLGCQQCATAAPLDVTFTFAFQPIIDWSARRVFAYEALIRGVDGAGAASVLDKLTDDNRYAFDQKVREVAIGLAARLFRDSDALLSINIMPNAVYEPSRCLATTLRAAKMHGFPLHQLMFEMTEQERVLDVPHIQRIATHYAGVGFTTAIDDFGSGYANLSFLTDFTPHVLKLDRELVRNVDVNRSRRSILASLKLLADELGIRLVAEGVETASEFATLVDLGYDLYQGYYFARPGFECLPAIDFEALAKALQEAAPTPAPAQPAPVETATVSLAYV